MFLSKPFLKEVLLKLILLKCEILERELVEYNFLFCFVFKTNIFYFAAVERFFFLFLFVLFFFNFNVSCISRAPSTKMKTTTKIYIKYIFEITKYVRNVVYVSVNVSQSFSQNQYECKYF